MTSDEGQWEQREGKSCGRWAEFTFVGLAPLPPNATTLSPADKKQGLFAQLFRKKVQIQRHNLCLDTCGHSVHHVGLLLVPRQIGRLGKVFLALLWKGNPSCQNDRVCFKVESQLTTV